ncbi:hypothetical protein M113_3705 [Bacteroides fragilis str. 3986 N3]|uniref:Uncharacterized protein n=5 Tax=Bacteroides fragilis TaxID=817 RepID=A0A015V143_BACFG|nr:hypothetical protein M077_3955 [Bacteroides fragilis str. 2-F-2 \
MQAVVSKHNDSKGKNSFFMQSYHLIDFAKIHILFDSPK